MKDTIFKNTLALPLLLLFTFFSACTQESGLTADVSNGANDLSQAKKYPVVDTGQSQSFDNQQSIEKVLEGQAFYGQDADYAGLQASYRDNQDGTIYDLNTGLMWAKTPDLNGDGVIDASDKLSYDKAVKFAEEFTLAAYEDWRLPSIKELYSLINFSGLDPSGFNNVNMDQLIPFIDTDYFDFAYGDESAGERLIDAQFVSSSKYVSTTMWGDETVFGVNFADGRIKGYPTFMPNKEKSFYVLYVRGNTSYGRNNFTDNGDGSISDHTTGLMWMKEDSGQGMNWEDALTYAENALIAGYDDWRLPNIKELQSIVDYSKSPVTDQAAAIDALFECTPIQIENGEEDYAYYWSGTTHENMSNTNGGNACYISFGRAMGNMMNDWIDVHGAGAQRSDPKSGSAEEWPNGHGPQGDAIRILNYVRLVRDLD